MGRPKGMDEEELWFFEQGEWDMFQNITNIYYGKQYYFLEDDGTVYSRSSGKTMTRREAYAEFLREVGE